MQFSDPYFWLLFACFYVIYRFIQTRITLRNVTLLFASYALYWSWSGPFLLLLVFSTASAYACGRVMTMIKDRRRTILLGVTTTLFLLILARYKYAVFLIESVRSILGMGLNTEPSSPLLPIGISFYTFQLIGYLIDVHRGAIEAERSLLNFALFISFFPKMIAGPLERAAHFLPQVREKREMGKKSFTEGFYLVIWGLVQKYCIADNAAIIVHILFFRHRTDMAYAMSGPLAVALHIYADFSGYSDIARGIAALLGFNLVWNFRMPYLSANPAEFWRRWHISLSEWFRDYVYIPLGGNRQGFWRSQINVLVTMTLVGLWHGAQWTFVLWGVYQGLLLITYRLLALLRGRLIDRLSWLLHRTGLAHLIFFVLTIIGWLLFESNNVALFRDVLAWPRLFTVDSHVPLVLLLASPIILMHIIQRRRGDDLLAIPHMSMRAQLIFYFLALYGLLFLPPLQLQNFIYVRF